MNWKLLAATGVLASTMLLPPSQAQAGTGSSWVKATAASYPSSCTATSTGKGVKACWVANGEKLYVKDTQADGRRVAAIIALPGYGSVMCWHALGNGKTGLCDFSAPENQKVEFATETCDASQSESGCGYEWEWTSYPPFTSSHT